MGHGVLVSMQLLEVSDTLVISICRLTFVRFIPRSLSRRHETIRLTVEGLVSMFLILQAPEHGFATHTLTIRDTKHFTRTSRATLREPFTLPSPLNGEPRGNINIDNVRITVLSFKYRRVARGMNYRRAEIGVTDKSSVSTKRCASPRDRSGAEERNYVASIAIAARKFFERRSQRSIRE